VSKRGFGGVPERKHPQVNRGCMELQNGDIFRAAIPLQTLVSMKLPVKVSWQLAKMANKVNEQLKVIEEVRQKLLHTYGEKSPEGWMVPEDSENFDKFMSEFKELLDQAADLDITKVKLPLEVDGKPLEVEAKVLMPLDKFIDME
jgi:hypothetical protein